MMKHFFLFVTCILFLNCSSSNVHCAERPAIPETDQQKVYSFIQMSDPQLGFGETDGFAEGLALLEKMVKAINQYKPSFVIVTGDMTNSSTNMDQYGAYKSAMSQINPAIPVYLIPGNHDVKPLEEGSLNSYKDKYGEDRFSFEFEDSYFIGINTSLIIDGPEDAEQEQKSWLEEQLSKASGSNHIFVFMHCPIVTRQIDEPDTYSNFPISKREEYVDILDKYHVDAVWAGHLHQSFECHLKNFRMITCGPSGKPLGKGYSGFNLVLFSKNEFSYKYIPL